MKEFYRLSFQNKLSLEEAWQELEMAGLELAYGEEEDDKVILYLYLNSLEEISSYTWIESCDKTTLPLIDWESQWALHGLDFHDGAVHVSFEAYGKEAKPIMLKPGPGFGDLSHPTTHLVLCLMARCLHGQSVVDIGSGSGVLSLAAIAMGAPFAYGIDIDPAAIEHASQNASFNQMGAFCHFCLPNEFQPDFLKSPLIVMNMISSEQRIAWESLPILHHLPGLRLTSGIRREEREAYMDQIKNWGWTLKEEIEQDGWLGFCFIVV